ncbi:iron-dependent repressor [Roseibium sp. TrichSKD4]|nr:iron-dependent repressor [Roseibium sp. TrichSKD4]
MSSVNDYLMTITQLCQKLKRDAMVQHALLPCEMLMASRI